MTSISSPSRGGVRLTERRENFIRYEAVENLPGLGLAQSWTDIRADNPGRNLRQRKGAKPIAATIERGLLKQADAYAKAHGLKRAELIAQALRTMIGGDNPHAA